MDGKNLSTRILKGTLTEISGPAGGGKTQLTLELISRLAPTRIARIARIAWIEREFTIYPPALARHGIDPQHVFFIDSQAATGGEGDSSKLALWAAQQALASRIFEVVVVESRAHDSVALRRLQLAAEKAQAFVILLSEFPTAGITWPIRTQLQVHRGFKGERNLQVTTLKGRGKGDDACQPRLISR